VFLHGGSWEWLMLSMIVMLGQLIKIAIIDISFPFC